MVDWDAFKIGGAPEPLAENTGNELLKDADPALYYGLAFWGWVIQNYPGPRIVDAFASANVRTSAGEPLATAVTETYPYEPTPQFLDQQVQLPALFAWRTRGMSEQWVVSRDHDICGVTVAYVLPPLDAAGMERLFPILNQVLKTLRRKTNDGWDPNYTPPGSLVQGDLVWKLAGVEEVGFGVPVDRRVVGVETGFEFGHLPGTGDLWMPCLIMRGYFTERDEYYPTKELPVTKFDGADITGNVKDDDGTVVPATQTTVVQAATSPGPAPPSGPVAGYQVVHGPATVTALPNTVYVCDVTGGNVQINVSSPLATGQTLGVIAAAGNFGSNSVTVTNNAGQVFAEPPPNAGSYVSQYVLGGSSSTSRGGADDAGSTLIWVYGGLSNFLNLLGG